MAKAIITKRILLDRGFTVPELAKLFDCTPATIYTWKDEREIPLLRRIQISMNPKLFAKKAKVGK